MVTNGLKICSRISGCDSGAGVGESHFHAFGAIAARGVDGHSQSAAVHHGIISVLGQIDEDLLGEIFVERDVGQIRGVVARDGDVRTFPRSGYRFQGAIYDFIDGLRGELEMQRAGEIEESGDERA